MTSQADKEAIVHSRLKKAFQFAKSGQYDKARYLLDGIQNPKAQELREQLAGLEESPQRKPIVSRFTLVVGGLGALAVILMMAFLPPPLSQLMQINNNEFDEFAITDDEILYADLASFCFAITGYGGELCYDWTESVIAEHETSAANCLPDNERTGAFTDEQIVEIRTCLSAAGIPEPL